MPLRELLVLSDHAVSGHKRDKWNAETILTAYRKGRLTDADFLEGTTADVLIATAPDRSTVGLLMTKPISPDQRHPEPYRVVITGFASSETYWRRQAG